MERLILIGTAIVMLPVLGNVLAMALGAIVTSRRRGGAGARSQRLQALEPRLRRAALALGSWVEDDAVSAAASAERPAEMRTGPDRRSGERRAMARRQPGRPGNERRFRERRFRDRRRSAATLDRAR